MSDMTTVEWQAWSRHLDARKAHLEAAGFSVAYVSGWVAGMTIGAVESPQLVLFSATHEAVNSGLVDGYHEGLNYHKGLREDTRRADERDGC